MRVALVSPSLSRDGGAERMSSLLADGLVSDGHDVVLITRYPSTFDCQPIDVRVQVRQLFVPRGRKPFTDLQLPSVVSSLRRRLRAFVPSVVIGSRWDCAILSLLATIGRETPVVCWEHGYLPYAALTPPWKILRALTYRRAAALVVINEASRTAAEQLVQPSRVHVVHNFVASPPAVGASSSRWAGVPMESGCRVLALGRLEAEKGFDRLIDAFALVAADVPDSTLMIVGRGSREDELRRRIAQSGLGGRVHLRDAIADPWATFADSDVFVLPSRHEGFGLALAEAMAAGLPVVAFDCAGGPREIVRHDVDGLLVADGDVPALAAALRKVVTDGALRSRLSQRAIDVRDRFSTERGLARWIELLREVTKSPARTD